MAIQSTAQIKCQKTQNHQQHTTQTPTKRTKAEKSTAKAEKHENDGQTENPLDMTFLTIENGV